MDSKSWPSVLTEVFGDVVRNTFRSDEYQYLGILSTDLIKMFDQFGALLEIAADFNELLNVVVGGELHRSDVDLDHVFQEILQIVSLSLKA